MNILITGGGGFLGQAICRLLVARGYAVTSFSRQAHAALEVLGVAQLPGDLGDAQALRAACAGRDAVFHNAAKAGAWGAYADYHRANVIGTQNVLDACRIQSVARLVYTSTPSVTHRAAHPVEGGNEDDTPYGDPLRAAYPATKAIAERAVLAANDAALATIALRPRLLWGPGDPHLLPGLVARARAGRLRLIDGGGNRIDTTFVDNAAQAHVDAFDHLWPGSVCAGKAYFISNGEPRPLRDIVNALLGAAGAPPVRASIPYPLAYAIGAVCELAWRTLPLRGEPPLTRFLAEQLATPHWYDIGAAARDFGYRPRISLDEGFAVLSRTLRAGTQPAG